MEAVAQVLRQLPKSSHPDLLVGSEHFDDAGVFRINETTALVQTLDFFPPLVDDPYTFGRIAAANSLSDIYAMGGRAITAMNIVGFPNNELPGEVLVEILKGGHERVTEAGAVIVGGHSVRDAEVKYGLSVTGLIDPNRVLTNGGAHPGDRLVLTKPIGSGVLTSAAKLGKMPEADLAEAIDVMIGLNRGAANAAQSVGVHAITDITGFGLIGHAFEMAAASGVTLSIEARSVPLMTDTMRFAREGVLTRAYKSNLAFIGDKLEAGSVDPVLLHVLADAQTSGGLLIAVSADLCDQLVMKLKENKTHTATIVGDVCAASPHSLVLL